eukprot:scpid107911/ scgid13109/ 
MEDNPFHLVKFVCDIQPWLNEVDADRLRQMVIKKHLISDSASIERLKRILSQDGQSAHNEELIKLIRAGGQKTYRVLRVVIEELGYVDRSKEMLSILSHTDESLDQQLSDRTGWKSGVFRKLVPDLVSMLTPAAMLRQCEAEELITCEQRQLFALHTGSAAQNQALLDALRLGDDESFHTFLECIRKVEP